VANPERPSRHYRIEYRRLVATSGFDEIQHSLDNFRLFVLDQRSIDIASLFRVQIEYRNPDRIRFADPSDDSNVGCWVTRASANPRRLFANFPPSLSPVRTYNLIFKDHVSRRPKAHQLLSLERTLAHFARARARTRTHRPRARARAHSAPRNLFQSRGRFVSTLVDRSNAFLHASLSIDCPSPRMLALGTLARQRQNDLSRLAELRRFRNFERREDY